MQLYVFMFIETAGKFKATSQKAMHVQNTPAKDAQFQLTDFPKYEL